jgi:CheY-like chemotaxis protein
MSRVVVAHDEPEIREPALQVARGLGLEAVGVADGKSALALLDWACPDILLADVGLPDHLGFELVEEVKRLRLPTRVILIASVYSRTAYKRRPTSLYGAFDYIEQHHIVDQLAGKLWHALEGGGEARARDAGEMTLMRERGQIASAGTRRLRYDRGTGSPAASAERLARLLVADVLLYGGDQTARWIEAGADLAAVPGQLAADLEEARRLFDAEVPEPVRSAADYIEVALERALRRDSDEPKPY